MSGPTTTEGPMTIIDKRRGLGSGSDAAQQAAQRAIDTNVPDHVKTGVRITGVIIAPGQGVNVAHKLGRVPIGWHLLRVYGAGSGSEVYERSSDANMIVFVRPAGVANFTYDFWVF